MGALCISSAQSPLRSPGLVWNPSVNWIWNKVPECPRLQGPSETLTQTWEAHCSHGLAAPSGQEMEKPQTASWVGSVAVTQQTCREQPCPRKQMPGQVAVHLEEASWTRWWGG